MKKKVLALVLMLAMVLSLAACGSKTETPSTGDQTTTTPVEDTNTGDAATDNSGSAATSTIDANTLVVGTTEMNGDFLNGFGNSSYDLSIKVMLNGFCATIHQTAEGGFAVSENTVVKEYTTEVDPATGNKTYTFTIYDDLKWSNGTPITAADYVAYYLWSASPEWLTAGASSTAGEGLIGYSAYYNGETKDFAGIKLIDDYTFSLTIDGAELPYFYEVAYVAAEPWPLAAYAPGAKVVSDDNGSHFEWTEGDLAAACQNVAETERFAPSVTCGPYKFVSFENQIVTLEKNENFKGDYEGELPKFQNVIQKAVPTETDVDQVIAGELDLVCGVVEGSKIEAAKASGTTQLHSYFRSGYGLIAFECDWGPTADPNVRWALASLIDRSAVIDYVLGGYGGTVDAEYGTAQWTYQEKAADLAEVLKPLTFNVEVANDYLDQSEYKYEADGTTPFDRSKATADGSYLRHNAEGKALVIEHMGTDGNEVTDIIEIQYAANAPLAGVKFNVTKGDFNALLDAYYYTYDIPVEERVYSSFNLATNFTATDDKYYSWHSDWYGSWYNANDLVDAELDRLTMEMRRLNPEQRAEYADLWLQFEVRWQELMPNVPLYSNEYFDICGTALKGLCTTPYASYEDVICKMSK